MFAFRWNSDVLVGLGPWLPQYAIHGLVAMEHNFWQQCISQDLILDSIYTWSFLWVSSYQ